MKKKTLVLTENFPPFAGGSGRWFWELYSRLPKDDFVVVADNSEGSEAFDLSHDVHVIRLPLKSTEWGFKSLQGIKYYWRTVRALKKIIREQDITHVHCGRVIHEGVTAWLLKIFAGIEYSCYVHGEDVETAATSREHDLMVRQVCKKAQAIICNSHNSEAIVKRLGYADDSKIKVLHPGVDTDRFVPAEADAAFKEKMGWTDRQVIVTVGRLQRRKGHDFMVQAMAQLKAQFPNTLYCIIGSGELMPELERTIKELDLSEHVSLLSEISDQEMIQCYQQADLFILPNRTINHDVEGFGMVLVEAQACGKPVIAGDSGGTKETMQIGETGWVLDCTSPDKISQQLAEILPRSDLSDMGQRGREFVAHTFDWKVHIQKAKAIFEQAENS